MLLRLPTCSPLLYLRMIRGNFWNLMEHIMSSYSFSHQFYQRWALAPQLVRAAIVQELTDINILLQPDTELAGFSFTETDLDTHIETLYDAHNAELAAADAQKLADEQRLAEEKEKEDKRKAEAEKAQEEKAVAIEVQDNQATTDDSDSNDTENKIKNECDSSGDSQAIENFHEPAPKQEPEATVKATPSNEMASDVTELAAKTVQSKPNKGHVNSNKDKVLSALQQHASADNVKPTPITDALAKAPILNQDNETLIHELGRHIDDYVSDQMAQLSEDLKSWLRAEIIRKLSEQDSVAGNSDNQQ